MELNKVICSTSEEFSSECAKWAGKSVVRGRQLIAYGKVVAELVSHRGGRREGSGRKPVGEQSRTTLTARVAPKTMERLRELQGKNGIGVTIDHIVESYVLKLKEET